MDKLWSKLWDSIPDPLTDRRLIVALDDFINPKTGKKFLAARTFLTMPQSQTRNAHPVMNHINFSMMAAAVIWIYSARLANIPERRHKVKGRNSFAFSDLKYIITKTALSKDFDAVCYRHPKSLKKYFIDVLTATYGCMIIIL